MKKAVITAVALTLALCLTVGGTLAWLMDITGEVKNTFTVGDINIELKEHNLKADGTLGTDEVASNDSYKVIPGGEQPKDPFVRVKANSENCYVYVSVKNNLTIDKNIVVTYAINAGWEEVATKTDAETGAVVKLYRYNKIVELSDANQELPVFTKVSYADTIVKDKIDQLDGKTIVLKAFAHQSANTNQAAADTEAKAQLGF